jgi:hypothetical protein
MTTNPTYTLMQMKGGQSINYEFTDIGNNSCIVSINYVRSPSSSSYLAMFAFDPTKGIMQMVGSGFGPLAPTNDMVMSFNEPANLHGIFTNIFTGF